MITYFIDIYIYIYDIFLYERNASILGPQGARIMIHLYIYLLNNTYVAIFVDIYKYGYIYVNMYLYIEIYMYGYVYIYTNIYICTYVYMYIYIYMYVYIYICIY
jgi:hypothetical protein